MTNFAPVEDIRCHNDNFWGCLDKSEIVRVCNTVKFNSLETVKFIQNVCNAEKFLNFI